MLQYTIFSLMELTIVLGYFLSNYRENILYFLKIVQYIPYLFIRIIGNNTDYSEQ